MKLINDNIKSYNFIRVEDKDVADKLISRNMTMFHKDETSFYFVNEPSKILTFEAGSFNPESLEFTNHLDF